MLSDRERERDRERDRDHEPYGPGPALLLCLGVTCVALFIALQLLEGLGPEPDPNRFLVLRLLIKPMPALVLATWVFWSGGTARVVSAGLVLSAAGDLLLELPGGFLFGLTAFLLGHLAYAVAFTRLSPVLGASLALPFAAYAVVLMTALDPHLGAMRVPVLLYAIVLSLMAWRAAARFAGARPGRLRPLAGLLGASFFMLSDTFIAIGRFVAPFAGERPAIMVTYWLAQTLIAASVATTRRPAARYR